MHRHYQERNRGSKLLEGPREKECCKPRDQPHMREKRPEQQRMRERILGRSYTPRHTSEGGRKKIYAMRDSRCLSSRKKTCRGG